MKEYDHDYMETHDIDWFCQIGERAIHCASNGGLIPNKVNNRNRNRRIQEIVANMEDVIENREEIVVNDEYVYTRLGRNESPQAYENYISTFIAMAKKGFVSFDRMIDEDDDSETYVWIAKPNRHIGCQIEIIPRFQENICPSFFRRGIVLHVGCLNREK